MRKALGLFIMLVVMASSLAAGTLDVGLIASPSLSTFAHDALEVFLDLAGPSSRLEEIERLSGIRQDRRRLDIAYHESLAKERPMSEQEGSVYEPYWLCDEPFSIAEIECDEGFAVRRDESMLEHVMLSSSLDIVFVFLGEDDGQIASIDIYCYAQGQVEDLYSTLYLSGDLDERAVIAAFVRAFSDEDLVVLDLGSFPSSSFVDSSTGEEIPFSGGYSLVKPSVTSLVIRREGYLDLEVPVVAQDGVAVLSGKQVEEDIGLFTLVVNPSGSRASLFGVDVATLPLVTSFDMGAVLMTVSKDGFRDENLQIGPGEHFRSVMLRPQWMADEGRLKEAKDEMYRSMRNTILSFGLYVLMSTLGDIFPESASWTGVAGTVTAGISIVNLIDFLHDCLSYYDTARQMYL